MNTPRVLFQFDTDDQPSTFDGVVAVDAGVDHLFRHGSVTPENVAPLVHGAMFTRGAKALRSTAIFIGGTNVLAGEQLLSKVTSTFFGPVRVSVMLDSNGSNTTAAAAVLTAAKHCSLMNGRALVLAGTGPVGRRVARLLGRHGCDVRIGSRSPQRAEQAAAEISVGLQDASIHGVSTAGDDDLQAAMAGCQILIACGAAGVTLIEQTTLDAAADLKLLIDLNAVPPAGLEGVEPADKGRHDARERICYGALGVGGLKMKIHRRAIEHLFACNDAILDAEAIYALGETLLG